MGVVIEVIVLVVVLGGIAAAVINYRRGRLDTLPRAITPSF